MRVYLGLEQQRADEAPLGLDWQQKKKEKTTTVYGTAVAGNTWNAVRAVGVVRADKEDILKLLIDDKRIGEFDDMFDSCTVRSSLSLSLPSSSPTHLLSSFPPFFTLFSLCAVPVQGRRESGGASHGL
jgi:hypothetical protein